MSLKKSLAVAATIVVAVFGAALREFEECGTEEPGPEMRVVAAQMAADERAASAVKVDAKRASDIDIPTYIHVVSSSKSESDGNIPDSTVNAAISSMNDGYSGSGFQFSVQKITRTVNADWSNNKNLETMKSKLRQGDFRTLNIYIVPKLVTSDGVGLNGQCTFPFRSPKNVPQDGCIVRTGAYSNEQTTPHEVGHWLGLYHTFQGETDTKSCDTTNDYVDDTPAMKMTRGCDTDSDTCPGGGKDPVTNFMSYNSCRTVFTSGQHDRMNSMYNKYRA
ncbi:metalloprotease 1 [Cordyceps fumosorosea ARSEF 2679]|uniref:Metalloprotease 1 n=1 Tax=Cordyceps fumosorosea (strain ARSEF 2679) TaxID=1081104 RepID=A0A167N3B3_CORFA|nr:metalloprotease 1 [Cordyceps fumosorosea ARSEF 2679]OAA55081.1 metalloprotease 1 [Cordyceps fumosorosea ARSEF 2679]